MEEYRVSISRRFDLEYAKIAALEESRKRSYEKMEKDSDSDDDIQSEFESYIQQQCKWDVENPLI